MPDLGDGRELAVIRADVDAEAALCAANALREKIEPRELDCGEKVRVTAGVDLDTLARAAAP